MIQSVTKPAGNALLCILGANGVKQPAPRGQITGGRGDLNAIVQALAAARIEDMAFPEAELEDIFLGYYQPGAAP